MQLSNAPTKIVLPFANAGGKNVIPVASQIGITPGAASFTDGFPPLTRTPIAAGGIPPSGLDMNGIVFDVSAITRWANAGAGYLWDSAFATDSNIGGYPKGAQVLRTDSTGYWLNLTDNNQADPEGAATGWVPGFTNGTAPITMTNANVTLTPLQYGKPIIIITGLLTGNLNLVFPNIANEWIVINSTTGAFTINGKTSSGTGQPLTSGTSIIVCDGSNDMSIASGSVLGSVRVGIQTFSGAGSYTYVPTSGMKQCVIECIGGGGGGGGASAATSQSAAGAGAACGTYAKAFATAAQIGASKAVVIGAGGAAGAAASGTGGNGGTTTVGSLISCPGGAGAVGSSPGVTVAFAQGSNNIGAATITTVTPLVTNQSTPGGTGFVFSATSCISGSGASSAFAAGGQPSSNANSAGNQGSLGSGGSGGITQNATTNMAGGAGGDGYVVITEYF